MLHKNRRHTVTDVAFLEVLVDKLVDHDWTTCTGFRLGELLVLNDSTGPDGAQEYAVVRDGEQVESLTVSWMRGKEGKVKLAKILADLQLPGTGVRMGPVTLNPHVEGYCSRCA